MNRNFYPQLSKTSYYVGIFFYGEPKNDDKISGEYLLICDLKQFPGLDKDGEREITKAKEILGEYCNRNQIWKEVKFLSIKVIKKMYFSLGTYWRYSM